MKIIVTKVGGNTDTISGDRITVTCHSCGAIVIHVDNSNQYGYAAGTWIEYDLFQLTTKIEND